MTNEHVDLRDHYIRHRTITGATHRLLTAETQVISVTEIAKQVLAHYEATGDATEANRWRGAIHHADEAGTNLRNALRTLWPF